MGKTDIHKEPFDAGTKAKLELLRLYIRGWLPVFIKDSKIPYPQIEIYDYFAGEGQDSIDTHGSPLIILTELKSYCANLIQKRIKLTILFNDFDKSKYQKLEDSKNSFLNKCSQNKTYGFCDKTYPVPNCPFNLKLENSSFPILFNSLQNEFSQNPSIPRFMFIDQYGIKYVTKEVFQKLVNLPKTDFLFFFSSSYLRRFKDLPEFKKYIDDNRIIDFSDSKPTQSHRIVYNYFKSLVTKESYFLGQFSIKKGSNVYGLIFGSNSHLGMRKFLDAAWKIDKFTGEANHDIDGDAIRIGQLSLDFDNSVNKIKKLYLYEQNLIGFLQRPKHNREVYVYSLEQGINIPNTNGILKKLELEDKIEVIGKDRNKGAFYLDFNPQKVIQIKTK